MHCAPRMQIKPTLNLSNPRLARRPRTLHAPHDVQAFAALVSLMSRFARDVQDKSELDRKVERAFDGFAGGRAIAQRLVRRFEAIPMDQRASLLGAFADATRQQILDASAREAFARLASLHLNLPSIDTTGDTDGGAPQRPEPQLEPTGPGPMRRSGGARVAPRPSQLFYRGIFCREESDFDRFTDSDEIFVVTNVVYQKDGENKVNTVKHPFGYAEYEDVDSSEWRRGPTALCWSGDREPFSLAVHLFESDDQNPQEYADEIKALATLSLAALGAAVPEAAPLAGNDGVKSALTTLIEFLLGSGADLIGEAYVDLSRAQIATYEARHARIGHPSGIPYHFRTRHVGDGAFYLAYFTFGR